MPVWASRITLEVTGVRVERLQEMSDEDAKAEGCPGDMGWRPSYQDPDSGFGPEPIFPSDEYRELWESIYGSGSWDTNPWVFVIEFRTVKTI